MNRVSIEIIFILLLTVLNGLFAMSEFALLSARKIRLRQSAEQGNTSARQVLALLENPNNFLSTVQVGVTLVGVLSGAFGGTTVAEQIAVWLSRYPAVAPYAKTIGIAIVVLAITYLSLVIGELVPKRIALTKPEKIAAAVASPMLSLSKAARPVVTVLSVSTDAVLRLMRVRKSHEPEVTEDDIRGLIREGTKTGVFEHSEQQIVERVFRFGDRNVGAIMTPRADITWLDIRESNSALRLKITGTPYSRFPVGDGDLDHLLGILYAKDFLAAQRGDIRNLLKQPLFVPERTPALKVLEQFRQNVVHMAIVIDENGTGQGLICATDVLEALVGELPDEIPYEPRAVQRADGSWLVDGALAIEDLKEILRVSELPGEQTGRFQTAAEFTLNHFGKIPSEGERFTWQGHRFEIIDMDGNKIDKLLVTTGPAAGAPLAA